MLENRKSSLLFVGWIRPPPASTALAKFRSRILPDPAMCRAAALVLLGAAVSHALSTPVFFDTNGRLQRGATPSGGQRRYVPVHDGLSLLEPHGGDGWRPVLLTPEEVERDDPGCVEAFLGTVAEGALAADAGAVRRHSSRLGSS